MSNDTTILYVMTLFFIVIGVVVPYMNDSFGLNQGEYDTSQITDGIDPSKQVDSVDALDVLLSIVSMFFWSFGTIPLFLEIMIFLPLRVTYAYLIYKAIRGIGG